MQFFGTSEGRIRTKDSTGLIVDYFLKDHLGNVRLVVTDQAGVYSPILEETHYYPFGLAMAGISSQQGNPTLANKDKTFQGQKFDDDLGLNWVEFKYRNHDPQIGRFIEIDPLSDKYVYNSTYAFSENKVTSHVELEGLEAESISEAYKDQVIRNQNEANALAGNAVTVTTSGKTSTSNSDKPGFLRRILNGISGIFGETKSGPGGKQAGGNPVTTAGEAIDPTNDHADHLGNSINADLLLLSAGSLNPVELPKDPHDWAAWAKDLTTGFNDLQGDSKSNNGTPGSSGTANPASTNGKSPILKLSNYKPGTIIYNRINGSKTAVLKSGERELYNSTQPANDTFPKDKQPGYIYPY